MSAEVRRQGIPPPRLLPFAEFEFPYVLGPAEGRYLIRGDKAEDVLLIQTAGAPRRRLLKGRRPRPAAEREAEASAVPITRATVVRAQPFASQDEAAAWLEETVGKVEAREQAVDEALALLNQALHAHRIATLDPYISEVETNQATTTRLGYGDGDRIADGGWIDAKLLPQRPPRRRRADQLRPQEHLAAILTGRQQAHSYETLILRARLDLDQNRLPEATLQARIAIEALLSKMEDDVEGLAELQEMTVAEESVREAIEICERILRRQRLLTE